MATKNVGSLVVLDGDGRPIGILTDRDIAIRCVATDLDPDGTSLGDVMTSPVETVRESTPIEDVLELLIEETGTIGRLLQRHQPALPS